MLQGKRTGKVCGTRLTLCFNLKAYPYKHQAIRQNANTGPEQKFVEKLATKHGVEKTEVEEVLTNHPRFRFISKGNRSSEDVYSAMGQTDGGRYLIVFFIQKPNRRALIISARDMTRTERRNYGRQR